RALKPGDAECISQLADAYTLENRHAEAAEVVAAAAAAHKGRRSRELAGLHHRLARIAQAAGDAAAQLTHLTNAFDMDAQNGVIASEVAVLAMHFGNLDVASRALRAVTMLKTTAPLSKGLAYQHLGEIAYHQGDKKKAMLSLKRALDEDP